MTDSDRFDIGHGVTIELVELDGELHGVHYEHPTPADPTKRCFGFAPVKPMGGGQNNPWTLVSRDPLTLSPSLLCRMCGHHGFIREGKWVPV